MIKGGLGMAEMTIQTFFTTVTGVVSGLVTASAAFIADLYSSNVIGQIIVTLGIASAVISLGYSLFLRKRKVR